VLLIQVVSRLNTCGEGFRLAIGGHTALYELVCMDSHERQVGMWPRQPRRRSSSASLLPRTALAALTIAASMITTTLPSARAASPSPLPLPAAVGSEFSLTLRARERLLSQPSRFKLVVLATFPRSGTTWTRALFRAAAGAVTGSEVKKMISSEGVPGAWPATMGAAPPSLLLQV
jgi:hypothetical protein